MGEASEKDAAVNEVDVDDAKEEKKKADKKVADTEAKAAQNAVDKEEKKQAKEDGEKAGEEPADEATKKEAKDASDDGSNTISLGESGGANSNMEMDLADFGVTGFGDDDMPDIDPYADSTEDAITEEA